MTRATQKSQSIEMGFPLLDHADWPGLMKAIDESQAEQILVTHSQTGPMVQWLIENGWNAKALIK